MLHFKQQAFLDYGSFLFLVLYDLVLLLTQGHVPVMCGVHYKISWQWTLCFSKSSAYQVNLETSPNIVILTLALSASSRSWPWSISLALPSYCQHAQITNRYLKDCRVQLFIRFFSSKCTSIKTIIYSSM